MIFQHVNEVTSHKHLGIYVSGDCTCHNHIEHIKAEVGQRKHFMCRLKSFMTENHYELFYFAFIRPLLEKGHS